MCKLIKSYLRGQLATWCTVYETPALKGFSKIQSQLSSNSSRLQTLRHNNQFRDRCEDEVNATISNGRRSTRSRSTTSSKAAALHLLKTRMKHQESNVAIFHSSICYTPACAVYSCKRLKFIPACTGWEAGQVSNLSQGNGSICVTISNHSQQHWITQYRVVVIRHFNH